MALKRHPICPHMPRSFLKGEKITLFSELRHDWQVKYSLIPWQ
jgi:hypothetical protein